MYRYRANLSSDDFNGLQRKVLLGVLSALVTLVCVELNQRSLSQDTQTERQREKEVRLANPNQSPVLREYRNGRSCRRTTVSNVVGYGNVFYTKQSRNKYL